MAHKFRYDIDNYAAYDEGRAFNAGKEKRADPKLADEPTPTPTPIYNRARGEKRCGFTIGDLVSSPLGT